MEDQSDVERTSDNNNSFKNYYDSLDETSGQEIHAPRTKQNVNLMDFRIDCFTLMLQKNHDRAGRWAGRLAGKPPSGGNLPKALERKPLTGQTAHETE